MKHFKTINYFKIILKTFFIYNEKIKWQLHEGNYIQGEDMFRESKQLQPKDGIL